jgi:DNA topoisomerase-1
MLTEVAFAGMTEEALGIPDAGLRYNTDDAPGIRRVRAGRGFFFRMPDGSRVADPETLARIRKLAIPPAYTQVWISPDPEGHIQATGRDAKGRKQYRYHPRWAALRDATKFERLVSFAECLPVIRAKVAVDMGLSGLGRDRVLATVIHLLQTTLIRIGNDDYARQNDSYGLTTLRTQHVSVTGSELRFWFEGKSGKTWRLRVRDRRVARTIRTCQDLPGQTLFKYIGAEGNAERITSADVNEWLRQTTGRDVTAKDFRTWAGTVLAAEKLSSVPMPQTQIEGKRQVKATMDAVAARLGNTASIARKSYVHPAVVDRYLDGSLQQAFETSQPEPLEHMDHHELRTLLFLKAWANSASETETLAHPSA